MNFLSYSATSNVSAIPFIDLGNIGETLSGFVDRASPVINLPSPLRFGEYNVTTAYVSSYLINVNPCHYTVNIMLIHRSAAMDSSALVPHMMIGFHKPSQYQSKSCLHTGLTVTQGRRDL